VRAALQVVSGDSALHGDLRMFGSLSAEATEVGGGVSAEEQAAILARFEEGIFGKPLNDEPAVEPQRPSGLGDAPRPLVALRLEHPAADRGDQAVAGKGAADAPAKAAVARRKRPIAETGVLGIASAPVSRLDARRPDSEQRSLLQAFTRPGPVVVNRQAEPRQAPAVAASAFQGALGRQGLAGGDGEAPLAASSLLAAGNAAAPLATDSGDNRAAVAVVCTVCMRGFESEAKLRRHEELSDLHKQNLARLREEI